MAQFQLFRYLKKWRMLIIAVCVFGCLAVFFYCNHAQEYTATAVIEYTHPSASLGQNPDGSLLDSSEMISSSVISDVISELGLTTNVESIRSRFRITSIIPLEETEKQSAYLELGRDYVYHPTIYQITYTVGSDTSAEETRTVLDSLLSNYFTYYCEKYVAYASQLSNAAVSTEGEMEYMDWLAILSETLTDSLDYLDIHAQQYPGFVSATTGYSFQTLMDSYRYIQDTELTRLNAYVLNNRLVKDKALMLERYRNTIDQYQTQIDGLNTQIIGTQRLISQFGQKMVSTKETPETATATEETSKVLDNVMEIDGVTVQTTYDELIEQYTELSNRKIALQTNQSRINELLDTFANATTASPNAVAWADEQIQSIRTELSQLYTLSMLTLNEFVEKNGADHLAMLTNVVVSEKINMSRYLLLAVIAFVFIGCGLAVVCGRAGDFVDYYLYADRRTGLPNRARCDMEIEQYEGKPLGNAFSCFAFKVDLHGADGLPLTRKAGDELLGRFAGILRFVFEELGFVGYNDNGMFLVFLQGRTGAKAMEMLENVDRLVQEANAEGLSLRYTVGRAETSEDSAHDIRSLIRLAITRYAPPTNQLEGE